VAHHLPAQPPALSAFAQLSDLGGPEEVHAFIERELDVEHVAEWFSHDATRLQRLADLVDVRGSFPVTVEHALDALGALGKRRRRTSPHAR
jgi:hypothetical protein